MILTPYGGVNEIGGNCFLLESPESSILLDFGRSFKQESIYFAGYLQPRTSQGLTDFLEFNTIPRIQGLYDDFFNIDFGTERKDIDGVFLSHAHMDHYGNLNLLHKSIPVYMGETAKLIIQSVQDTTRPRFGRPYIHSAAKKQPSSPLSFLLKLHFRCGIIATIMADVKQAKDSTHSLTRAGSKPNEAYSPKFLPADTTRRAQCDRANITGPSVDPAHRGAHHPKS